MRTSRRLVAGAAVLAAALAFLTFEAAHAVPPASLTALTIDGTGDNPVLGAGHSVSFSGAAVALANHDGGVTVSATNYSVELLPPTGGALTQSQAAAPTSTTATASDYGLIVTANGTACATGTGSVTIKQLTLDGSAVTVLAASYTTTCGASSAPVAGEIRWNSTTDFVDATQDKSSIDFGHSDTGYPTPAQVVTFTSVGSQPIQFQAVSMSGGNFQTFEIVVNTCTGQSIAPGATCAITLVAKPFALGATNATLTIADNSTVGSRTIALASFGFVGGLGTYVAVAPTRLLDTRINKGASGVVGPGGVVHLRVTGGEVPTTGVMAVVMNVTETGATANDFLTVYPTGVARPTASNLNFTPGTTVANSVTVQVGSGGMIDIYNSTGKVQLIADISGYFVGSDDIASGGQYTPVSPLRLLDTRDKGIGALAYRDIATAGYTLGNPDTDSHIKALVVNITAVTPAANGWFTAWNFNGSNAAPTASTLNFVTGRNVANMAIVPAVPCHQLYTDCPASQVNSPTIAVENFAKGSVNLIVDIIGFFDDGSIGNSVAGTRFHPITPTRIVDTRSKLGAPGPIGAKVIDTIPVAGADDLTRAIATNVTAVNPTVSTFMIFWGSGNPPTVSTLNPAAHQTVANSAIITLAGFANQFDVKNNAGTTGFLVDVSGYYEFDPNTALAPPDTATAPEHAAAATAARVKRAG